MDDQQTPQERACVTARLRDIAEYHFGTDICSRLEKASEYQSIQREALMSAADEIDRLRQELASK